MIANAKAQLAPLSSDATDEWGDPIENPEPPADARWWPISITEKRQTVLDPTSGEQRTIVYSVGRISPLAKIEEGTRLHDNFGRVHLVEAVMVNPRSSLAGRAMTRFTTRGRPAKGGE